MKNTLMGGVALAAVIATAGGAHAQDPSNAELAAQVRELKAQVTALTALIKSQPTTTNAQQAGPPSTGGAAVTTARSATPSGVDEPVGGDQGLQTSQAAAPPSGGQVATANHAADSGVEEPVGGVAGKQGATKVAPPTFSFEGGLRATDAAGDAFRFQGRILVDAVDEDVSRDNGKFPGQTKQADYHSRNIRGRQIQIGAQGQIGQDFAYLLEGGFQNGGSPQWAYAYLQYNVSKQDSLIFGNTKSASLENITSEKYRTFMDGGPYLDLTDTSYVLSIVYAHQAKDWSFRAALQGASLNNPDVTAGAFGSTSANERTSGTVRATWIPINETDRKLHLGAWARYRNRGGETGLGYTAWSDSNFHSQTSGGTSLITTGGVGNNDLTVAGEFAYLDHALTIQAEAADIHVDRLSTARSTTLGGPDFDIRTAYASISWFPTGEGKNYIASGQFGRGRVFHPVDQGGYGAFEIAARADYADLSDLKANPLFAVATQTPLTTAGRYAAGTFALNWYPIPYVKFAADYTYGRITNRRVGPIQADADVSTLQFRSQIDF